MSSGLLNGKYDMNHPLFQLFLCLALVVPLNVFSQSITKELGDLSIVGINAQRPEAKNDYYSRPVILENFMGKNDPYSNKWLGNSPVNQQVFFSGNRTPTRWDYALDHPTLLQLKEGTLYVTLPKTGIYTVMGVLISREECEQILSADISDEFLNCSIFPARKYKGEIIEICKSAPTYKTLQNRIMDGKVKINPCFYVLQANDGNQYYMPVYPQCGSFGDIDGGGDALKMDFYSAIVKELKGKRVLYLGSRSAQSSAILTDFYDKQTKMSVQGIDTFPSEIIDDSKELRQKALFCKDVLVDIKGKDEYGNDVDAVLAVIENAEKTATISYPLYYFRHPLSGATPRAHFGSYSIYEGDGAHERLIKSYSFKKSDNFFTDVEIRPDKSGSILTVCPFISETSISKCVSQQKQLKAQKEKEQSNIKAKEQAKARQEYLNRKKELFSKYGETLGTKILDHQLAIGMTPEMCKESIGWPNRTFQSITASKQITVFYYVYMAVYFDDGKLSRIDSLL
ncbi:MAG: hypothetical protein J6Y32_05695 [Bacteroidales bacterium]|nr:hypothetical protein [Bacteroidales bacterium]